MSRNGNGHVLVWEQPGLDEADRARAAPEPQQHRRGNGSSSGGGHCARTCLFLKCRPFAPFTRGGEPGAARLGPVWGTPVSRPSRLLSPAGTSSMPAVHLISPGPRASSRQRDVGGAEGKRLSLALRPRRAGAAQGRGHGQPLATCSPAGAPAVSSNFEPGGETHVLPQGGDQLRQDETGNWGRRGHHPCGPA